MSDSISVQSNNSMEPDPVTLSSIHSYLKEMAEENKAKNKSLEELVQRVSKIENDRNTTKRKVFLDPTSSKLLSTKKPCISDVSATRVGENYVTGPNQFISILDNGSEEIICEIPSSAEFIQPDFTGNPVVPSGTIESPQFSHGSRNAIPTICSGVSSRARCEESRHGIPIANSGVNARALSVQSSQPELFLPSNNNEGDVNFGASTSLHDPELLVRRDNDFEGFLMEDTDTLQPLDRESTVNVKANCLPIISSANKTNWSPGEEVMQWFASVADIDLTDDQIKSISDEYQPNTEVSQHFEPPQLPSPLWHKCKSHAQEAFKQRSLHRIQQLSCSAIKPLIDVLDSLDPNDPNREKIAASIQLTCSANLRTSRLRRALTARFIKQDIKQNLFSQPITHLDLFGSEFQTAAENANKSQATIQKVFPSASASGRFSYNSMNKLTTNQQTSNFQRYNSNSNQPGPSSGRRQTTQPFHFNQRFNSSRGKSSFRRRGRGLSN